MKLAQTTNPYHFYHLLPNTTENAITINNRKLLSSLLSIWIQTKTLNIHTFTQIYHQFTKGFNNPRQHHTVAVFLDMSKVFDTVNIHDYIKKHSKHHHQVHSQPHSKHNNKHAFNTVTHSQSSNKSISGVAQGGVRSPTLFKIYISYSKIPFLQNTYKSQHKPMI